MAIRYTHNKVEPESIGGYYPPHMPDAITPAVTTYHAQNEKDPTQSSLIEVDNAAYLPNFGGTTPYRWERNRSSRRNAAVETDEPAETLFTEVPASIEYAISTKSMRHTFPTLAGLALNANPNLTFSSDLSRHSLRLARKAPEGSVVIPDLPDQPTNNMSFFEELPSRSGEPVPESEVKAARQTIRGILRPGKGATTATAATAAKKGLLQGHQFGDQQIPGQGKFDF